MDGYRIYGPIGVVRHEIGEWVAGQEKGKGITVVAKIDMPEGYVGLPEGKEVLHLSPDLARRLYELAQENRKVHLSVPLWN